MTFFIEMSVDGAGMMIRPSGGDNGFTSLLVKCIDEVPAVIALIGWNCCVMDTALGVYWLEDTRRIVLP